MALVSFDHEFVFIKTRKTAGTSVEMLLEPFCTPKDHIVTEAVPYMETPHGIVARRLGTGKRPPHYKLRTHAYAIEFRLALGRDRWRRFTKISAVRNPFDRVVSYFHWLHHERIATMADFGDVRAAFGEFVLNGRWKDDRMSVRLPGHNVIDHFVRYEHMHEDIERLSKATGLPIALDDLQVTKSMARTRKGHDVPDYYDTATIARVRKRMAWAFEAIGYPETPLPRLALGALT